MSDVYLEGSVGLSCNLDRTPHVARPTPPDVVWVSYEVRVGIYFTCLPELCDGFFASLSSRLEIVVASDSQLSLPTYVTTPLDTEPFYFDLVGDCCFDLVGDCCSPDRLNPNSPLEVSRRIRIY